MTNILALETSSPVLSVALKKGDSSVQEKTVEGFFNHAENLLPAIDDLLNQEGLKINEIDTFLIGRGPGSFTGLRVGFATLKGILTLRKIQVWGALSLDIIAAGIKPEKTPLAVCLDARRQKFYVKLYQPQEGQWDFTAEPQILSIEEALAQIPKEASIVGDSLERHQDKFKNFQLLESNQWYPRASTMIHSFTEGSSLLQKLEEPADFIPLYFRRSEAEERKEEENANSL